MGTGGFWFQEQQRHFAFGWWKRKGEGKMENVDEIPDLRAGKKWFVLFLPLMPTQDCFFGNRESLMIGGGCSCHDGWQCRREGRMRTGRNNNQTKRRRQQESGTYLKRSWTSISCITGAMRLPKDGARRSKGINRRLPWSSGF